MLDSLVLAPRLSVGVVVVEVRGDGQRERLLTRMLARGFLYVGQLYARTTAYNAVVDDCFVNVSHLRTYMPRSRALRELSK